MKPPKALVVEHGVETRQDIDEILSTLGHPYDCATSLAEARQFLAANGHAYILLGHEIPARVGGVPRMQNVENFLDELSKVDAHHRLPVIIMLNRMPDVDDEAKIRWAADMRSRGATTFICKPFRTAGRTPDRVIKKVLAGQVEPVRIRWSDPAKSAAPQKAAPHPAASSVPNEPVTLDEFMARFCEPRSKDNRMCRKKALLAAARHGTVTLPPLASGRKPGQANRYVTHDLLAAWQGFQGEGVDLPALLPEATG